MGRMIDLTGHKYGRLTVIEIDKERTKPRIIYWKCKCDCGKNCSITRGSLRSKNTKSCGCLFFEMDFATRGTTHGRKKDSIYSIYITMKARCRNPNGKGYKNYGGRGIKICDRWMKFENFLEDMGERPKGLSLDRIDNNGDYCPENCRWATKKQQSRNQRKNKIVEIFGNSMCLAEAVDTYSTLSYQCVLERISVLGWSVEDALLKKLRNGSKNN